MDIKFVENWAKRFKSKLPEPILSLIAENELGKGLKESNLSPVYRDLGIIETNTSDLEDSQKNIIGNLTAASSVGRAGSAWLLSRQISDEFTYGTSPALQVISSAVGDYEKIIGQAVTTSEQIKYEYGTIARNAVMGVTGFIDVTRYTGRVFSAIRGARAAGGATAAATASTGVGLLLAIVEAAVFYILGEIAQKTAENIVEGRARDLAFSQASVQMLDLERPKNIYTQVRSVFGTDNYLEELDSILSRQNYSGKSLTDLGYDYESISPFIQQTNQYRNVNVSDITSKAFDFSAISGMSEEEAMRMYLNMTRVNNRYSQDINLLQEGFERFFGAVTGNSKPQQAHNKLVSALVDYTQSYALSSGRLSSYQNNESGVTSITRFMSQAIGNDMNITTSMNTISGVDDLLMSSFSLDSAGDVSAQRRRRMLQNYGINRNDALSFSVTENPDTFNQVVGAFATEANFNQSDFDSQGRLTDEDSARRYMDLTSGMNPELIQNLLVAIRARVEGKKAVEVQRAFFDSKERVEKYTNNNIGELTKTFAESSKKFVETTSKNIDTINKINELIVNSLPQRIDTVLSKLGEFTQTIYDTFNLTRLKQGDKLLRPGESMRVGFTTYSADATGTISKSYVDTSSSFLTGGLSGAVASVYKNLPVPENDAYVVRYEKDEQGNAVQKKVPLSQLDTNLEVTKFVPKSNSEFIDKLVESALRVKAEGYDINVAVVVAQAALESGYGTSGLSTKANNLFGIKASSGEPSMSFETSEYTSSGEHYRTDAAFRVFESYDDSLKYYADTLLERGWAKDAKQYANDSSMFLQSLLPVYSSDGRVLESGYATDPNYYNKIMTIISNYGLDAYSTGGKVGIGSGGNSASINKGSKSQNMKIVADLVDRYSLAGFINNYIHANI